MRDWLSPQELADLALPGLPETRQGWNGLIERERWRQRKGAVRPRAGRGGGLEYHVSLLSPDALLWWVARRIVKSAIANATREGAPLSNAAVAALLHSVDRFSKRSRLSPETAIAAFAALYSAEGNSPAHEASH